MATKTAKEKLTQAEIKEEKASLEEELQQTLSEMTEIERRLEDRGDYSLGEGDPAIHNWELNLALYQRMRDKVESLRAALQRVEDGSYGICQRCGGRIDRARLDVVPAATLCIECAREGRR